MFVLDSVPCTDAFPADGQAGGAQIVAQNGSTGGFFTVTGADAYVQLAYQAAAGASLEWTPPVHVGTGNGILSSGTRGVRFRNYVAGVVATVSAGLSEPLEPPLQLTSAGVASASSLGGMRLIQNQVLLTAQPTITFSNIDQTFAHLYLVVMGRSSAAVSSADLRIQLNGDVAANYDWQFSRGNAANAVAAEFFGDTSMLLGSLAGNAVGAGLAGMVTVDLPSYSGSTFNKMANSRSSEKHGVLTTNMNVFEVSSFWRSGAAITSLVLLLSAGSFMIGSQASLYGLAAS